MARLLFGGTAADVYLTPDAGGALHEGGGAVATFWTAQTGGTQITDLQNLSHTAISSVTTSDGTDGWSPGQLPQFFGPDNMFEMWVSVASSPRVMITAANLGSGYASVTQGSLATHMTATNPHAVTLASLTDVTVGSATTGQVLTKTSTGWNASTPSGAVSSVNSRTGAVVLSAADVGADANGLAATAQTAAQTYTDTKIATAPAFIVYNAATSSWPARSTVTASSTRLVIWVGPVAPAVGGAGSVDGLDVWWKTP